VKGEESDGSEGDSSSLADVWPEEQVQEAARLIRSCFVPGASQEVEAKDLTKTLEAALDAPRHKWPTALCRRLWEFLSEVAEQRKRSPSQLSRWYHLVGYCLRPGFGDPLDKYRVEQLWKLMHAPPRAEPGRPVTRMVEGGADHWIMWRRVAGGLGVSLQ